MWKRKAKLLEVIDTPGPIWTPIEAIDINGLEGELVIGKCRIRPHARYKISFDDLWDLTEACEAIVLEHGGRLYKAQAPVVNRGRLALRKVIAGPQSIAEVEKPPEWDVDGFYLQVDMGVEQYHNFFVHLEDLVALLHRAVADAQGLKPRANPMRAAVSRALH